MTDKVLIIEDDDALRGSIVQTLELEGLVPIATASFVQARRTIRSNFAGIILSDIRMPDHSGFDVLRFAQGLDPDLPVILLTGHSDVPTAMRAMREGAYDYLEKPCATDTMLDAVRRGLDHRGLVLRNRAFERQRDRGDIAALHFPGKSDAIKGFRDALRAAAGHEYPVHIWGEPGLAKRTAAYVINQLRGEERRFLSLTAPAVRAADLPGMIPGGPLDLSIKMLDRAGPDLWAVVQGVARRPDLRLFSTGAVPWARMLEDGLPGGATPPVEIHMPSLEARRGDLPEIFEHLVRQVVRAQDLEMPAFTAELAQEVSDRAWVGNLPEMRSYAARVAGGGQTSQGGTLSDRLDAFEQRVIEDELRAAKGRVAAAAVALGIPRNTLYDRMARFGLVAKDFRA